MAGSPASASDRIGPDASTGRLVVLTRSGVRRLSSGHPWIYPDHVEHAAADDGTLVRLEGPLGTPRGLALWSGRSRLPLRVVSRDPRQPLADDWWMAALDEAIARRGAELAIDAPACRWVHAEADGLPGLVIDRYGSIAVVQASCLWADRVAPAVARRLVEVHGLSGVLARHDGGFRKPEGLAEEVRLLAGEVPDEVPWEHAGITRPVDPWRGQKTGAYLDQRENQTWAAGVLPVGRCLDAFCHDGGFALHLARAGSEVLALDSSAPALERLTRHAADNGLAALITPQRVNVFDHLRELETQAQRFDGIVLDPPALAKRKGQVPAALRAYKDLNLRAMRLLRDGGRLVTASCSYHLGREAFVEVLGAAAADARRRVVVRELRGAAACHPHLLTHPESSYLKLALLDVL